MRPNPKNNRQTNEYQNKCEKELYDYIKANCISFKELRSPLSEHSMHKSGKIIGITDDNSADDLLHEIRRLIDIAEGDDTGRTIDHKLYTAHALGDVLLSAQKAYRRISIGGEELQNQIGAYIEHLLSVDIPDNELVKTQRDLIELIDPKKRYISAAFSGMNYRVTYFDTDMKRRLQKSVNDILIIIGNADTRILDAPPRKERSDKQPLIGIYYVPVAGKWVQRNIYEFDERYLGRLARKGMD